MQFNIHTRNWTMIYFLREKIVWKAKPLEDVVGCNQGNWVLFLTKLFHPCSALFLTFTSHFHGEQSVTSIWAREISQHTWFPKPLMKMHWLLGVLVKIRFQVAPFPSWRSGNVSLTCVWLMAALGERWKLLFHLHSLSILPAYDLWTAVRASRLMTNGNNAAGYEGMNR